MHSTRRFFSAFALAAVACLSVASAYASDAIVSTYRAARAWVGRRIDVVAQAFTTPQHLPAPAVKFVSAMAFVMRQAKRARPTVTPRWRMCPSA